MNFQVYDRHWQPQQQQQQIRACLDDDGIVFENSVSAGAWFLHGSPATDIVGFVLRSLNGARSDVLITRKS